MILIFINTSFISEKVETDYKLTISYIESLKKHIKQLHKGSKEQLVQKLETYDQNLTQKFSQKRKVLF